MWVNEHDHDHLSKSDFARIAEKHAREWRSACADARYQPDLKVLDLGCGDGTVMISLCLARGTGRCTSTLVAPVIENDGNF